LAIILFILLAITHEEYKCLPDLINAYKNNSKYDDILELYDKYNTKSKINIDEIVCGILNHNLNINTLSKNILKTFNFSDMVYILYENKLEIFKFTMEIPLRDIYDDDAYVTFKIIKNNMMPYRKYTKVPKYVIIEITKWLFK